MLDKRRIDEPEFNLEVEERKSWWERFYLQSNPFPRKDGLQSIDRDLYNSVVVKTDPFIKLQNDLKRTPHFLFNTGTLLIGDFGYGKTTFLDYLEYDLIRLNIVSLRVTPARAFTSATAYLDSFLVKLEDLSRSEAETIHNRPQRPLNRSLEDCIAFNCELICDRKLGVVIILDDYHKHLSQQDVVFEFLGMLQIIKDQLGRSALNVGFIVSGLPEWKVSLPSNTQLSGFLDSPPIVMPDITPALVADVFNKRIAAFCFDTSARTIRQEFIERVFEKTGKTSYREYLNVIITELEQNNLAIVNSPIDISEAELVTIKHVIETEEANATAFRKLLHESKFQRFTSHQIRKCLEMLVQVALRDGVAEGDRVFEENLFYFQRLKDVNLLQKRRGGSNGAQVSWTIHNRLRKAIDEVTRRFKRAISDYLLKIYGGQSAKSVVIAEDKARKSRLAEIDKHLLPTSVVKKVADADALFQTARDGNVTLDQGRQACDRARIAITYLLDAVYDLDESSHHFRAASIEGCLERAANHWTGSNEDVLEAIKRLIAISASSGRAEVERALRQADEAFNLLEDAFIELYRDITDTTRPFAFRHRARFHNADTLLILSEAQKDYYSADATTHFNYVRKVADMVESHTRKCLYVTGTLAFGLGNYFDQIPEAQPKDAYKNAKVRDVRSAVFNHFDGLTRSQYRSIFCDKSRMKEMVADHTGLKWSGDDKKLFFDLLAEESIASSHNQVRVFSHVDRQRYMKFCSLAEEFIAALGLLAKTTICSNGVIIVPETKQKQAIEDCVFKFGVVLNRKESMPEDRIVEYGGSCPLLYHTELQEHTVDSQAFERVKAAVDVRLMTDGWFAENIFDVDFIQSHYGISCVDYVCCLTYGARMARLFNIMPWSGTSIVVKAC